jgi:ArsR family transcriptional regulator
MKTPSPNQLLKAFADETRLRILNLLSDGELCVCDLMAILKVPQPKVSRHLAYLRRHDLVNTKRDGQWIYYSLSKPVTGLHKRLVSCLDDCLDDTPIFTDDKKALKTVGRESAVRC